MRISKGLPAKKKIKEAKNLVVKQEISISPAGEMTHIDWRAWGINLLKFAIPSMTLFLELVLRQGVPISKAWPLAVYSLYQAGIDLYTKKYSTNIRLVK